MMQYWHFKALGLEFSKMPGIFQLLLVNNNDGKNNIFMFTVYEFRAHVVLEHILKMCSVCRLHISHYIIRLSSYNAV